MRNIIYKTIGVVVSKDGTPNRLYENVSRETSLYIALDNFITESIQSKAEVFVSFMGLKYQALSIVNYLWKSGYNMLGNANKKDLRVKTYRLRYTGEQCYYIQIKTSYKGYVTLQAMDPVIGQKQMPETLDDLKRDTELYNYTRSAFLSGLKNSDTRILYSSASISRTMFNRENNNISFNISQFKREYHNGKLMNVFLEEYNRPSVHGGYNYLSDQGRAYTGPGIILDVNSLYDYIAANVYLPYPYIVQTGEGTPEKKYIKRDYLFYTVMKVSVSAELKEDGIPCILQDGESYGKADYLTKMKKRLLTLTPYDRKMLFENYNISYYRIESYIVFRSDKKIFRNYIAPLYEKKRTLPKGIERDFVKSCLVGFIGTFARKAYRSEYIFKEKDGHMIAEKTAKDPDALEKELKRTEGACFINAAIVSASRAYIASFIKKHIDRFLYTDTDSIHLKGTEIPSDIPVSDKMGDFKVEHTFTRCKYNSIKNYVIVEDGRVIPTIAGIPKDSFDKIVKMPGVDAEYIKKAVSHKDPEKLYQKPIGIRELVEDIDTGTVSYEPKKVMLSGQKTRNRVAEKLEAIRKRREGWDWYNGREMDRKAKLTYGDEGNLRHHIERWNDAVDEGIIQPSFEKAVEYLRKYCS